MTQPKNNSVEINNTNQSTQIKNQRNNMYALNLRWQEIRKWELNYLRSQALNHRLTFTRTKPIANDSNTISNSTKNDNRY